MINNIFCIVIGIIMGSLFMIYAISNGLKVCGDKKCVVGVYKTAEAKARDGV
jgi:hypothetical protein